MEIWKEIKDFPGYSVSNYGRVKSHDRIVLRKGHNLKLKGKVLKPGTLKKCGHRYVNLRKNGMATSTYVHRLVAEHFIGAEPEGRPHVAHWDGDASNNNVSNLRWASAAENSADAARLGRNRRPSGTQATVAKLSDEDIISIYAAYADGEGMRSIGRRYDISHGAISKLLKQKSYSDDCKRLGIMPATVRGV